MDYKFDDFKNDYSEEEDYFGREDELAFMHSLCEAFGGDEGYMRVLGEIYSCEGYGVKTDYNKSVFWYERAVEKGDIYSAVRLAALYYCGNGVPRDYAKAFPLYELAAKDANIIAMARLGTMKLYGLGCEKNLAEARSLLHAAADLGDREACYEYAHILKGEGEEGWKDFLIKSANQSYGKACVELLENYADELTDVQYKVFLVHAASDCSQDFDPIKYQLTAADCFLNGKRMNRDLNAAKSYLNMAAKSGSEEAKAALEKYFKNG